MVSWEPVDIDLDGTGDEEYEWDDNVMNDLEMRFEELRQFNKKFNESHDNDTREEMLTFVDSTRHDIEELVADQIYDKFTTLLKNTRKKFGTKEVRPIDLIRKYDKGIDKDIRPYRNEYVKERKKLRKLDDTLNERLKAMIEMTSKDINTTIKDVEQDTSFIKPDDKDKLSPLRELEGLDRQLRTIRGSLKVAIAKRVDLKARIEQEERNLNEIQDPTYSDDQRNMIEDRIKRLRDELNERNKEIDILKDEASKQINQIKESITKFLDKETGTLGKRIRTLFKEQGITIVSILTAVGMAIGALIETLLGGPSVPATTTSGNTSGGEGREWVKNKLKALSHLPGKLADKALASLQGIIGSIISWILNRAKEVIGWLSQQFVGAHNRCRSLDRHIFYDKDKKKVSHLNIHQTVKIDVIPNTKATFSSS